jgi:hypothetical protein
MMVRVTRPRGVAGVTRVPVVVIAYETGLVRAGVA